LRRIFGPKRNEETGEWRRLHNKELYALYSSPNNIRMIKSRRLRWAERVARMRGLEVHSRFWWGNVREGDHLEDRNTDGISLEKSKTENISCFVVSVMSDLRDNIALKKSQKNIG
jgi:hypothetical protein